MKTSFDHLSLELSSAVYTTTLFYTHIGVNISLLNDVLEELNLQMTLLRMW